MLYWIWELKQNVTADYFEEEVPSVNSNEHFVKAPIYQNVLPIVYKYIY